MTAKLKKAISGFNTSCQLDFKHQWSSPQTTVLVIIALSAPHLGTLNIVLQRVWKQHYFLMIADNKVI